jgi:multicomponent Na+:H+ antiporter subunit G
MIGEAFVLAGALLTALSALGVVRLAPVLARMHALTKASTGGMVLALVGGMLALRTANAVTSLTLALLLQIFTFPVGANLVAHAVYRRGDAEGRHADKLDDAVPARHPEITDQAPPPDAENPERHDG